MKSPFSYGFSYDFSLGATTYSYRFSPFFYSQISRDAMGRLSCLSVFGRKYQLFLSMAMQQGLWGVYEWFMVIDTVKARVYISYKYE